MVMLLGGGGIHCMILFITSVMFGLALASSKVIALSFLLAPSVMSSEG